MHESCRISVLFAIFALFIKAANRQAGDRAVESGLMPVFRIHIKRVVALTRNLVGHAGEEVVDQCAAQTNRLEIIAAAIAGYHRNAHFGHDLQQAFVNRGAKILRGLGQA